MFLVVFGAVLFLPLVSGLRFPRIIDEDSQGYLRTHGLGKLRLKRSLDERERFPNELTLNIENDTHDAVGLVNLQLIKCKHKERDFPSLYSDGSKIQRFQINTNTVQQCYQGVKNHAIICFESHGNNIQLYGTYRHGNENVMVESVPRSGDFIQTGDDVINLRVWKPLSSHILYDDGLVFEQQRRKKRIFNRKKRSTGSYTVELFIAVDYSIYKYWYDDSDGSTHEQKDSDAKTSVMRYMTWIFNGMSYRYNSIQSTFSISLKCTGVYIATSKDNSTWTEPFLSSAGTVNVYDVLNTFSQWIRNNNGVLPPHDHAMLFSKYDFENGGRTSNRGFAATGQMCQTMSQSIIEYKFDFSTIISAAHELGHSLGANHDDDTGSCNTNRGYIMAATMFPRTGSISRNPWTFSTCSIQAFDSLIQDLNNNGENCLAVSSSNQYSNVLANYNNYLPGQLYSADEQCRRQLGNQSYLCRGSHDNTYTTLCTAMYCYNPSGGGCTATIPGDGTQCGDKMWCVNGECVCSKDAPDGDDSCLYGDDIGKVFTYWGQPERTCSELVTNYLSYCYDDRIFSSCCSSCNVNRKSIPDCEYGNKNPSCKPECVYTGSNAEICCESCYDGSATVAPQTTAISSCRASLNLTATATTSTTHRTTTTSATSTTPTTTTTKLTTTTISTSSTTGTTKDTAQTTTTRPPTTTSPSTTTTTTTTSPSSGRSYTIELFMVVDYSIYKYWYDDSRASSHEQKDVDARTSVMRYMAWVFNGISFRYSTIQSTFTISLKSIGVYIASSKQNSTWTESFLTPSGTVNVYDVLNNFSAWIRNNKDELPPHDHAMLFSRYNFENGGRTSNRGFAATGAMCQTMSQSIIEYKFDFSTIISAAHELGHSLGASHDENTPNCNGDNGYIMAATMYPRTGDKAHNPWMFSSCSVQAFDTLLQDLDRDGDNCLVFLSSNQDTNALDSYKTPLPGQLYSADEQCRRQFGNQSYLCRGSHQNSFTTLCTSMYCHNPSNGGCTATIPGDGTQCGDKMWCINGECACSKDAPDGDDSCLYGDDLGKVFTYWGQPEVTCSELLTNYLSYCYDNRIFSSCCTSCASKRKAIPDCEYGNKNPSCKPECVYTGSNAEICCESCYDGSTTVAPQTTAISSCRASLNLTATATTSTTPRTTTTALTTTTPTTTTTKLTTTTISTTSTTGTTKDTAQTTTTRPPTTTSPSTTTTTTTTSPSIGRSYTIELLMVVDYSVYKYWYDDSRASSHEQKDVDARTSVMRYMAWVFNGMSFRYSTIQSTFTISLKSIGVYIASSKQNSTWTEPFLTPSDTVNVYDVLNNFSAWIRNNKDELPPHDHAMLFSRYNFENSGRTSNRGFAATGAMCQTMSQSIIEYKFDFSTIISAAHELGHSLGASHDEDTPNCNGDNGYIMAATMYPRTGDKARNPWMFSSCSVQAFDTLLQDLDRDGDNCLVSLSSNQDTNVLDSYKTPLPGQLYSADEQCRRQFGNQSYLCRGSHQNSFTTLCTSMYCHNPSNGGCTATIPGDGTQCGDKMWCINGECACSIDAPGGDDSCLYGDDLGKVFTYWSQPEVTCTELVTNYLSFCYDSRIFSSCCTSCASKRKAIPDCEFGNKNSACKSECVYTGDSAKVCCESCYDPNDNTATVAPSTSPISNCRASLNQQTSTSVSVVSNTTATPMTTASTTTIKSTTTKSTSTTTTTPATTTTTPTTTTTTPTTTTTTPTTTTPTTTTTTPTTTTTTPTTTTPTTTTTTPTTTTPTTTTPQPITTKTTPKATLTSPTTAYTASTTTTTTPKTTTTKAITNTTTPTTTLTLPKPTTTSPIPTTATPTTTKAMHTTTTSTPTTPTTTRTTTTTTQTKTTKPIVKTTAARTTTAVSLTTTAPFITRTTSSLKKTTTTPITTITNIPTSTQTAASTATTLMPTTTIIGTTIPSTTTTSQRITTTTKSTTSTTLPTTTTSKSLPFTMTTAPTITSPTMTKLAQSTTISTQLPLTTTKTTHTTTPKTTTTTKTPKTTTATFTTTSTTPSTTTTSPIVTTTSLATTTAPISQATSTEATITPTVTAIVPTTTSKTAPKATTTSASMTTKTTHTTTTSTTTSHDTTVDITTSFERPNVTNPSYKITATTLDATSIILSIPTTPIVPTTRWPSSSHDVEDLTIASTSASFSTSKITDATTLLSSEGHTTKKVPTTTDSDRERSTTPTIVSSTFISKSSPTSTHQALTTEISITSISTSKPTTAKAITDKVTTVELSTVKPSTAIPTQNFQLTITLDIVIEEDDIDDSGSDNYRNVFNKTTISLTIFYARQLGEEFIAVIINKISRGSLVVDHTVVTKEDEKSASVMTNTIVDLANNKVKVSYDGQDVGTKSVMIPTVSGANVTVIANQTPCDIFLVLSECNVNQECQNSDSGPECRVSTSESTPDNLGLVLGLFLGISLFLFLLITVTIVTIFKGKKMKAHTLEQKRQRVYPLFCKMATKVDTLPHAGSFAYLRNSLGEVTQNGKDSHVHNDTYTNQLSTEDSMWFAYNGSEYQLTLKNSKSRETESPSNMFEWSL